MTMSNLTTVDRLFHCKCAGCNFHNLDPRNLAVHFATNDRSLVTKHQKRPPAYLLHLRALTKDDACTFEFVYYNDPPSPSSTSVSAATGSATSYVIEAEWAGERNTATKKCWKSSLPREVFT